MVVMTDPQSSDHPHTPSIRWSQSGCLTITWSPFATFPATVASPENQWGIQQTSQAAGISLPHLHPSPSVLPPHWSHMHALGASPTICVPCTSSGSFTAPPSRVLPTLTNPHTYSHHASLVVPCTLTAFPSHPYPPSNPCYTSLASSGACLHPEPSMCQAGWYWKILKCFLLWSLLLPYLYCKIYTCSRI